MATQFFASVFAHNDVFSRRQVLKVAAGSLPLLGGLAQAAPKRRPRVAAVYTVCTYRSHAHVILENFLGPFLFNGKKTDPGVDVVSIYADQRPGGDMTPAILKQYGLPVFKTIDEALCVGGKELAVDAVLSIGEHGSYPRTKLGQTMYPRKRFFDEIASTMKRADRFVPVFNDKHLSYRWDEGLMMYETAKELGIPFMAGSSVPLATRRPALELPPGQVIDEAVAIHGGPLESYGFHGLELLQSMVESRKGGETGIASVEFLEGEAVWNAAKAGRWSIDLARKAMNAELGKPLKNLREVPGEDVQPTHAFLVNYLDGTKATVLRVGKNDTRWNFACRMNGEPTIHATSFYVGPWQNRNLFKALSHAIQHHFIHGTAPYPVERTLLVTGALESAMRAAQTPGTLLKTPHLELAYKPRDYRAMREMGDTWKILTPEVPQPAGLHLFGKE
jgi:extradiol dioxygenase family protein